MIIKGITDTVIQPCQYVVWDKLRARYRAFDGFKDTPFDIVGMYRGDLIPSIDKPPQPAIPNQEIYIDTEPHRSFRR